MTRKQWLLSGFVAFTCLASTAAMSGPIENYAPVTAQRLENPEPANWMLYRRTYDGQGYSPLDQINTSNVKNLTPVWTFATGVVEGHEAPPIVNNGVMFVATPMGQVIALNAKTGDEYWRYKRQLPDDLFQLHPTSRGVGLWEDKLYLATTDDHVVALDAKTGKVVWDTKVQDYKKGQYMTLMPLIVDGKVIVGGSGGEFGVRGYVAAYDAKDGKELWRTYTIPGEGEPGHDTWQGEDWKNGGGSAWMTGNYDKDTKTIYWGVGNAAPWPGEMHPGDNLYTSSVLALDPNTGKIKTYHQYHQNDSWDWDEVEAPMLIDLQRDGRNIKSLVHPGRDAIFWILERTPTKINYVAGWPFVSTDVWKGIDAEWQAGRRSRAQADGRQARGVLSVAVGRQGLALGGLQPEDRPRLRARQREFLRRVHRREGSAQARRTLARHQAGGHRAEDEARGGSFRRAPGLGPRYGQEDVATQLPEIAAVRIGDGDRGRSRLRGRHQRPQLPRLQRQEWRAAVGAEDQFRYHGHAGVL